VETNTQQLIRPSQPSSLTIKNNDVDEPLSYKEWYKTHTGIVAGQEYNVYNIYVSEWYYSRRNISSGNSQLIQIKLNYLSLLKQLQVFFTESEKEKWYNFINIGDEKEILLSIPYFAKKLKEISLYYIELRKKLKNTKLQYNLRGTNTGAELEVHDYILNNFTHNSNNTLHVPAYILNNIPELSAIKDTLVIQVEEIYDDHSYFDQSLTLPVSAYYDLNDATTSKFFKTKGLNLPETE